MPTIGSGGSEQSNDNGIVEWRVVDPDVISVVGSDDQDGDHFAQYLGYSISFLLYVKYCLIA